MNKRIYFILFPILALLFSSSNGRENKFISFQAGIPVFNYTCQTSVQNSGPFSSDLKKGGGKINKNAIRIKAWDGSFAIDIPAQWTPTRRVIYSVKPVNSTYTVFLQQAYASDHNLRGPPAAIYLS